MGLFSSKKKEQPTLPTLPELPNILADMPQKNTTEFHELPKFPNSGTGEKFSQNAIKSAVTGPENDFEIKSKKLPPLKTEIISKPALPRVATSNEPIFIRLDHFEEGLKVFDETKNLVRDVEKLLKETKALKEKEDEELSLWNKEIQQMKEKIEKVNKDIFSKV